MAATYMHIGIPVLNRKPNMVFNEWGKFWVNESVDAYDYKIEYLKFEEGIRLLLGQAAPCSLQGGRCGPLSGRCRPGHFRTGSLGG